MNYLKAHGVPEANAVIDRGGGEAKATMYIQLLMGRWLEGHTEVHGV